MTSLKIAPHRTEKIGQLWVTNRYTGDESTHRLEKNVA